MMLAPGTRLMMIHHHRSVTLLKRLHLLNRHALSRAEREPILHRLSRRIADEFGIAILNLIERWYDVKIDVADPALNARAVRGQFQHETAEQAIAAIALALNANYRISGNHITLSPEKR